MSEPTTTITLAHRSAGKSWANAVIALGYGLEVQALVEALSAKGYAVIGVDECAQWERAQWEALSTASLGFRGVEDLGPPLPRSEAVRDAEIRRERALLAREASRRHEALARQRLRAMNRR